MEIDKEIDRRIVSIHLKKSSQGGKSDGAGGRGGEDVLRE